MKKRRYYLQSLLILFFLFPALYSQDDQKIRVSLQKRIYSAADSGYFVADEIQFWDPEETAIIICDMWDQHWCEGATRRVAELAPHLNRTISIARDKGVLIVHAPSSCMGFYKDHPARNLGQKYKSSRAKKILSNDLLDPEKDAVWPIDQEDGGCDDHPACTQGSPWTRQIDVIGIRDVDAISDSGVEIAGLFEARKIRNVILMGVHENMCIINRPFGLRNMIRLGLNAVVMRDHTDTMYNSEEWPVVSHFTGNSLMTEYIETYICPSMLSTDFTGEKQFRFQQDTRPLIAFIFAENEYHANHTLPCFAHDLMLEKGLNCEFAAGKPEYVEPGLHNIENLQILNDAALAVIFVRRRALPADQMELIKDYVNSGKPVLGIRTASHAFDVRKPVQDYEGTGSAKVPRILDQWPDFDKKVLGGNYTGHYGTITEGIIFSVVPGMENHPLLTGVTPEDFIGAVAPLNSLYQNRPLRSPDVQVILTGKIPGKPGEPVLWVNHNEKNKVIYTSMGHWEDWKNKKFRQIIFNAVDYLLVNK